MNICKHCSASASATTFEDPSFSDEDQLLPVCPYSSDSPDSSKWLGITISTCR